MPRAEILRMLFFVKNDETLDPVDVRLFRPDGVMPAADFSADSVEELWGFQSVRTHCQPIVEFSDAI